MARRQLDPWTIWAKHHPVEAQAIIDRYFYLLKESADKLVWFEPLDGPTEYPVHTPVRNVPKNHE